MTQPIGVVYVPVGLAGCNGIIRFTVVEQDVPPPLLVGTMRTLQASLDLNDDGDKVISLQFGGESSLRTLQSGHTVIRADQVDPDGWQLPGLSELCQNNDEGRATNYMSVIAHEYQRPRCRTTIHRQETMTQHPHAVADHGRRQPPTTTDLRDLIRPISPTSSLGSRVVNKCTVLFKTISAMCGRALDTVLASTGKRPVEIERPFCPHGHGSDEILCL